MAYLLNGKRLPWSGAIEASTNVSFRDFLNVRASNMSRYDKEIRDILPRELWDFFRMIRDPQLRQQEGLPFSKVPKRLKELAGSGVGIHIHPH